MGNTTTRCRYCQAIGNTCDPVYVDHERDAVPCDESGFCWPEQVSRFLYRWGQHSGAVYAASTEEARRVIEASGVSSTSKLFIEAVLTD